MKCSIFIILVSFVALSYCRRNYFEECLFESGVAKDTNPVVDLDDPKLKCFNACLLKKKGVIKDGKIDADQQFEVLKRFARDSLEVFRDLIKECAVKANEKNDECEIANTMKFCMMENYKKRRE